jgi:hypothetical protein
VLVTKRRESTLAARCRSYARCRGIVSSKLEDPTGIMDTVFWRKSGRPLLVEFKDGSTEPNREKLQKYYRRKFAKFGYQVAKIETIEQFLKEIDK